MRLIYYEKQHNGLDVQVGSSAAQTVCQTVPWPAHAWSIGWLKHFLEISTAHAYRLSLRLLWRIALPARPRLVASTTIPDRLSVPSSTARLLSNRHYATLISLCQSSGTCVLLSLSSSTQCGQKLLSSPTGPIGTSPSVPAIIARHQGTTASPAPHRLPATTNLHPEHSSGDTCSRAHAAAHH